MITGEIRAKVDQVWNAFGAGGISNPLEVIEQITYLLLLRRLDEFQTLEENKATRTKKAIENAILPTLTRRAANTAVAARSSALP